MPRTRVAASKRPSRAVSSTAQAAAEAASHTDAGEARAQAPEVADGDTEEPAIRAGTTREDPLPVAAASEESPSFSLEPFGWALGGFAVACFVFWYGRRFSSSNPFNPFSARR